MSLTEVYAGCTSVVRRIMFETLLSHSGCGGYGGSFSELHPTVRTLEQMTTHAVQVLCSVSKAELAEGGEAVLEVLMMEALPYYTNEHMQAVDHLLRTGDGSWGKAILSSSGVSAHSAHSSGSSTTASSPGSHRSPGSPCSSASSSAYPYIPPPPPSLAATAVIGAATSPLRRPPKAVQAEMADVVSETPSLRSVSPRPPSLRSGAFHASEEVNSEEATSSPSDASEEANSAEEANSDEANSPERVGPKTPKTPLRPVRVHRRRVVMVNQPVPVPGAIKMPEVHDQRQQQQAGRSDEPKAVQPPTRCPKYSISKRATGVNNPAARPIAPCPAPPTTTPEATMRRGGQTVGITLTAAPLPKKGCHIPSCPAPPPTTPEATSTFQDSQRRCPADSQRRCPASPSASPLPTCLSFEPSAAYLDGNGQRYITDESGDVRWVAGAGSSVAQLCREEVRLVGTEVVQERAAESVPSSSNGCVRCQAEGEGVSTTSSSSTLRYRVQLRKSVRLFAVRSIHSGNDHSSTYLTRFDYTSLGDSFGCRTAVGFEMVLGPEWESIEAAATSQQLTLGMTLPAGPDARPLKCTTGSPGGTLKTFPLPSRFPMQLLEAYPLAVHFRLHSRGALKPNIMPSILIRLVFEDVLEYGGAKRVEAVATRRQAVEHRSPIEQSRDTFGVEPGEVQPHSASSSQWATSIHSRRVARPPHEAQAAPIPRPVAAHTSRPVTSHLERSRTVEERLLEATQRMAMDV